jgi:hypothetical protein
LIIVKSLRWKRCIVGVVHWHDFFSTGSHRFDPGFSLDNPSCVCSVSLFAFLSSISFSWRL